MTSYDVVSSVTDGDAAELWPVYDAVFGDRSDSRPRSGSVVASSS
jgi:hypothetical protein